MLAVNLVVVLLILLAPVLYAILCIILGIIYAIACHFNPKEEADLEEYMKSGVGAYAFLCKDPKETWHKVVGYSGEKFILDNGRMYDSTELFMTHFAPIKNDDNKRA